MPYHTILQDLPNISLVTISSMAWGRKIYIDLVPEYKMYNPRVTIFKGRIPSTEPNLYPTQCDWFPTPSEISSVPGVEPAIKWEDGIIRCKNLYKEGSTSYSTSANVLKINPLNVGGSTIVGTFNFNFRSDPPWIFDIKGTWYNWKFSDTDLTKAPTIVPLEGMGSNFASGFTLLRVTFAWKAPTLPYPRRLYVKIEFDCDPEGTHTHTKWCVFVLQP